MNSPLKLLKNTLNGYQWDQFNEIALLGKGGFGRVMSASYKNDKESSFAIKYFTIYQQVENHPPADDQISIEDAENEIICLESLSKLPYRPNTLPIFYGFVCLVNNIQTEFRLYFKNEGYLIKTYFKKKIPEWKILKFIIDQLMRTFAFLQSHGFTHRDLKPGNILIKDEETDKMPKITVIDFGIAKKIKDSLTTKPILTNMGGTASFLSPERINISEDTEQKLNPYKSDTFSLGLVILNLIIGKVFKSKINEEKIDESLKELLDYLLSVPLDEEEKKWYYKRIFKKMLIYDSSKRPDFIELYYSLCNKNRKNVANHLLFDFLTTENLLEKYMVETKDIMEELFSNVKKPKNKIEEKKESSKKENKLEKKNMK